MIRPYRRKLLLQRFAPGRQFRKFHRLYSEFEHLLDILPQGLTDVLEQMQTGRFDIHLDHRGLEPSVNRLVWGLLASSMFVGASLMLSWNVKPLIDVPGVVRDISAPGLASVVVSLGLGLRLWLAINKSGHLDQKKKKDY